MSRAAILVVDDDPDNRIVLRRLLERRGFDVSEAASGPEGLAMLRRGAYDVVLLDLTMPEMDGFAVCERIRADADPRVAGATVVILSARRADSDRLGGLACGADDFLFKPWTPEELLPRLQAAVARSRLARPPAPAPKPETPHPAKPPPVLEPPPPPPRAGHAETREEEADDAEAGLEAVAALARRGIGANLLALGAAQDAADAALRFAAAGLRRGEPCLYVALRTDASEVRRALAALLPRPPREYEAEGTLELFDAHRWLRLMRTGRMEELFADEEVAVWNLVDLVQRGGARVGQSAAGRRGGRRIFDSLGPILEELGGGALRAFVSRVAATAGKFGGVTTLFLLDPAARGLTNEDLAAFEGSLDAVVEVRSAGPGRKVEVLRMRGGGR